MGARGYGVRARGYGNPCDYCVTPVPIGLGFEFGTALGLGLGLRRPDLGLGLDNYGSFQFLSSFILFLTTRDSGFILFKSR